MTYLPAISQILHLDEPLPTRAYSQPMTNFDLHQQKKTSIPTVTSIDYAGLPTFDKKMVVAGQQEKKKTSTSKQEDHEGWLQLGFRSCTSNRGYAPINQPIRHSVCRPTIEANRFIGRPPTPQVILPKMFDNDLVINPFPNISNVLPASTRTACNSWQFGCLPRFTGEEMSVVRPLPRQHVGAWLELHATKNKLKESLMLPQILKRYIRIKDEKMTVRLVMKYLASKLSLEDESEVDVTCRGRQLPPFVTLQQVRDSIWCSRDADGLIYSGSPSLPDSPQSRPVMILEYSKNVWCTDPQITRVGSVVEQPQIIKKNFTVQL